MLTRRMLTRWNLSGRKQTPLNPRERILTAKLVVAALTTAERQAAATPQTIVMMGGARTDGKLRASVIIRKGPSRISLICRRTGRSTFSLATERAPRAAATEMERDVLGRRSSPRSDLTK
ncbi:MAG TPA: hypothetical protein VGI66_07790 [Streptosporangiaceae bacterium]